MLNNDFPLNKKNRTINSTYCRRDVTLFRAMRIYTYVCGCMCVCTSI